MSSLRKVGNDIKTGAIKQINLDWKPEEITQDLITISYPKSGQNRSLLLFWKTELSRKRRPYGFYGSAASKETVSAFPVAHLAPPTNLKTFFACCKQLRQIINVRAHPFVLLQCNVSWLTRRARALVSGPLNPFITIQVEKCHGEIAVVSL